MDFHFDHWEINDIPEFKFQSKSKRNRQVKYSNKCSIVLIPTRKEYIDAGIELWYKGGDFKSALKQVVDEVNTVMMNYPHFSREAALKFLYQPNNMLENKSNNEDMLNDSPNTSLDSLGIFDHVEEKPQQEDSGEMKQQSCVYEVSP